MARRIYTAYIIGLSINEDLKLKKRKGRDRQQREKLYTITRSREGHVSSTSTITSTITAVFCQCCNISHFKVLKFINKFTYFFSRKVLDNIKEAEN